MNGLTTVVDGLRDYRSKLDIAIDALAALLPAQREDAVAAVVKQLPKRTGNGKRKAKAPKVKASSNGKRPRLTDEQRAQIRKLLATHKIGQVCALVGVSYPTVKKIKDEMGAPSAPPPASCSRAEACRWSPGPLQLLRTRGDASQAMRSLQEGSFLMVAA